MGSNKHTKQKNEHKSGKTITVSKTIDNRSSDSSNSPSPITNTSKPVVEVTKLTLKDRVPASPCSSTKSLKKNKKSAPSKLEIISSSYDSARNESSDDDDSDATERLLKADVLYQILKSFLVSKNGNNIADVLEDISSKIKPKQISIIQSSKS